MNQNFDLLCRHFEQQGVTFTTEPGRHVVDSGFQLKNLSVRFVAHLPADTPAVTFALVLPVTVPPARRAAVGEFLHRVNHDLRLGHFDLDYDDGEVRLFVASLPDPAFVFTVDAFKDWLLFACLSADCFGPELLKVTFGQASPAHAVEQAGAALRDRLESRRPDHG